MQFYSLSSPLHRAGFFFSPVRLIRFRRIVTAFSAVLCLIAPYHPRLACRADVGVSIIGSIQEPSGAPLPGALIEVDGWGAMAVADWDGSFRIGGLQPGVYQLRASYLGFAQPAPIPITVNGNEPATVIIRLYPQPYRARAAVVVQPRFQRKPTALHEATLTRTEWERRGARTLSEALNQINGVTVLEGDNRARVSLFGCPPRAVTVRLDDVPLNSASSGEADLAMVNLERLDAIRVTFSGLGGEVELLSHRPPLQDLTGEILEAGGGSFGLLRGGGELMKSGRRLGVVGRIDRTLRRGDLRYRLDDGTEKRRVNNATAVTRASLQINGSSAEWQWRTQWFGADVRRGVPGLIYGAPTPTASLESSLSNLGFTTDGRRWGMHILASGFYSRSRDRFINPAEQFDPSTGYIVRHIPQDQLQTGERWGGRMAVSGIGRRRWQGGYEYQSDHFLGEDRLRGRVTIGEVGLGAARRQLHRLDGSMAVVNRAMGAVSVKVSPSVRLERIIHSQALDYSLFNPAINAGVEVGFGGHFLTLWTGWGRSTSAPPFSALFTVNDLFAVGNPDLKPERGWGGNLTVNWWWTGQRHHFQFNINGYHRRVEDLIIWRRSSFNKYFPDNIATAVVRGLNFGAEATDQPTGVHIAAKIEITDSRIATPGDINQGNFTPFTPLQSGMASITLPYSNFTITATNQWVGRRFSTESNLDPGSTAGMGLPPYSLLNLRIAWHRSFGRMAVEAHGAVNNMSNRNYRIVERTPMPGRSFEIGLKAAT